MTDTKYVMVDVAALEAMSAKFDVLGELVRKGLGQSQESRWYSIKEFAAMKNRSECTIRDWISRGQLQARGRGGLREVRQNDGD